MNEPQSSAASPQAGQRPTQGAAQPHSGKRGGTVEWPPLVGVANQPLWLRLRDVLLTVVAWGLLGWMLARPLALAIDFLFIGPVFELTHHEPVDWRAKWLLLRPFAMAAGILVVWVLVWALLRTRPLAASSAQPAPTPLALADHAARWGLEAQAVATWHTPRVALARFDDAQQVRAVQAMALPPLSDASKQRE